MKKSDSNPKPIIAIDGPAGSGKSTVARRLAMVVGVPYLDTGAMYRALTWYAVSKGIKEGQAAGVLRLLPSFQLSMLPGKPGEGTRVWVNGTDVSLDIRKPELTREVHWVASIAGVRAFMVEEQRRLAGRAGAVIEGRDIGTVVFPDAPFKFYLDASIRVRAKRRYLELKPRDPSVTISRILREQADRDAKDKSRAVGALKKAPDAIRVSTSELTIDQVVDRLHRFTMAQSSKQVLSRFVGCV